MEQYIEIFSIVHKAVFWPLFAVGIFFSGNANIRWAMLFLLLADISDYGVAMVVSLLNMPGWTFHVGMACIAWWCYQQLIFNRPWYAVWLSRYTQKIPVIRHWLPTPTLRIYSAELALRTIFALVCMMHIIVILHWFAKYIGLAAPDGLFHRIGLWPNVLYDASLVIYCIVAIVDALLLTTLIIERCRERLVVVKA